MTVLNPTSPPAIARTLSPAPTDPLTGQPFVCLRRGDIVEVVAFVIEYRRAHPTEQAALVLPPITHTRQAILPVAAFTREDGLYLHTPILGDVRMPGRPPSDIARGAELFSDYIAMLPARALPPRIWPDRIAGDTEERQLQRALSRLRLLGVVSIVPRFKNPSDARLILEFDGMQFGWSPRYAVSYYNGLADPPTQNSVIEGILFTLQYRRDHPNERAFAYIHPAADRINPGRLAATNIYTRDGKTYSHHRLTGDLESPLKPSEITDAAHVIEVTDKIYEARRAAQRIERRALPPTGGAPPAPAVPSLEDVREALVASGVQAHIDRPASASGAAGDQDQTLTFEWQDRLYTYATGTGCFPAQ
jgi:hypothetical protein